MWADRQYVKFRCGTLNGETNLTEWNRTVMYCDLIHVAMLYQLIDGMMLSDFYTIYGHYIINLIKVLASTKGLKRL